MADETIEQLRAHRDQLKAENDRLNPENDGLKATVDTLNRALADANAARDAAVAAAAAKAQTDARDAERVGLCDDMRKAVTAAQSERGDATARLATMKQEHAALVSAVANAAGPLVAVLESIRAKSI